ncbi:MAG: right-handed parallel beta-helix repeat-containing protein [Solirubrobacterales bacterium]
MPEYATKEELEDKTLESLADVDAPDPDDEEAPVWNKNSTAYKPRKLTYRNLHDSIYGANVKGEASMKAAFEAAIEDAIGRTLYIPKGTHLGSGLVIPDNAGITLVGDGESTIFKFDAEKNVLFDMGVGSRIEGIKIEGNREGSGSSTGDMVNASLCPEFELGHIWIVSPKGKGVKFSNAHDVYIHDVQVVDPGSIGVLGELNSSATVNGTNVLIERCIVDATAGNTGENDSFKLSRSSTDRQWEGAHFHHCASKQPEGAATGMGFELEVPLACTVSSCKVDGGRYGISFARGEKDLAIGNVVSSVNTIGIELSGSLGGRAIGNHLEKVALNGIAVNDNSGNRQPDQLVVAENVIKGCGQNAIRIYRPITIGVSGNQVHHEAVEAEKAAVWLQATGTGSAMRLTLDGNDIDGGGVANRGLYFECVKEPATYLRGGNHIHDFITYGAFFHNGKFIGVMSNTYSGNATANEAFGEAVEHGELKKATVEAT